MCQCLLDSERLGRLLSSRATSILLLLRGSRLTGSIAVCKPIEIRHLGNIEIEIAVVLLKRHEDVYACNNDSSVASRTRFRCFRVPSMIFDDNHNAIPKLFSHAFNCDCSVRFRASEPGVLSPGWSKSPGMTWTWTGSVQVKADDRNMDLASDVEGPQKWPLIHVLLLLLTPRPDSHPPLSFPSSQSSPVVRSKLLHSVP